MEDLSRSHQTEKGCINQPGMESGIDTAVKKEKLVWGFLFYSACIVTLITCETSGQSN